MIKLYYNNAYKWYNEKNIYVIGFAFFENKLYLDEQFLHLVIENNLNEIIDKLNGCFSIVIKENNSVIICSDRLRCFPVFYTKNGDVSDDINLLKTTINELSMKEMKKCCWTSGSKTIYENVFQIEAGQVVTIKKQKIMKKRYYEHTLCENNCDFEELDKIFNAVFKRLIIYLNGRKAVIPLSGGQDSRLLAYYLKKNNYKNIIAFTYGNKSGGEVEVSKKVAEFLDIPWYFVEYTQKNCQKYYNKNQDKLFDYHGRGNAIPLIQDLTAISVLLENGIIDQDCVIVPGFSLDFLVGNHTPLEFSSGENVETSIIRDLIYANNYNLNSSSNEIFNSELQKIMNMNFNNEKISSLKASEKYEQYDLFERQAKFINNNIRTYDYFGLSWYLPFWDTELMSFFQKLPIKDKYERAFFKKFVEFKYNNLMNFAPVYVPEKNSFNGMFKVIKKIKYLFYNYHNHRLNLYYHFKFHVYFKNVLFHRIFRTDYYVGEDYEKQIRKGLK